MVDNKSNGVNEAIVLDEPTTVVSDSLALRSDEGAEPPRPKRVGLSLMGLVLQRPAARMKAAADIATAALDEQSDICCHTAVDVQRTLVKLRELRETAELDPEDDEALQELARAYTMDVRQVYDSSGDAITAQVEDACRKLGS